MTSAQQHPADAWRKSSYSDSNGGECLEIADGHPTVPVRDSKNPHGPTIIFPPDSWSTFVSALKRGELPTA